MTAVHAVIILKKNAKNKKTAVKRRIGNAIIMAHFYNYYYVGDTDLSSENTEKFSPILLTFSKVRNGPKGETAPHFHTHLEIFYFESGSGVFECKNKQYPIKPNDLLAIDSKQLHVQYSDTQNVPLVYYCIAVDNLHLKGRETNCLSGSGFFMHSFENKNNIIYRNILRLLDELKERKYSYATKVNAIFSELLIDAARLVPDAEQEEISESKLNNRKILNDVKIISSNIMRRTSP